MKRAIAAFGLVVTAALVAACDSAPAAAPTTSSTPPVTTSAPEPGPGKDFTVQVVASGLEHGWDVGFLPGGKLLVTERPGKLALVSPGGKVDEVKADFSDLLVAGEGGLLGLLVDPEFARNRQFVTCQDHQEGGRAVDIRLVVWKLAADEKSATKVRDLLTGLPVNPSGRHSGCRPLLAKDGSLLVGTGDTAQAAIAQDKTQLGGKVLRLDLRTGGPVKDNPFVADPNPKTRLVYNYGHRNVQGIALRPGTDQVFTAEHGPDKNDEVNIVEAGKNYGWDPSRGGTMGGYDENTPMTDLQRFPDAVPALWESGATTEAICGAAFLTGKQWGPMEGTLVITALKGAKLLLLKLNDAGTKVESVTIPPQFQDKYGRLRAARTGPDGALYVTTSNGTDDKVLRITP
ncbi:PQQ-dependent sugar dehydrogenase [Labedaea rhizosphaerae]|uniref:Glucose/arabinose dehydrogenase n=1 Tax=Labedaea rhizosphaerae TaxID=598644 RepID=A0A4R6SK44_LABRH|nr:PQQ-dependent sugar dehydrogenase [Labedaea rhizosphaerae]TDQ04277.1 glucose/arabinose dehydrogenase [Labedaea rhizosphaerae]